MGGETGCPDKCGVREVRAEKEGNTPTPNFLLISQKPAFLGGSKAAEKNENDKDFKDKVIHY